MCPDPLYYHLLTQSRRVPRMFVSILSLGTVSLFREPGRSGGRPLLLPSTQSTNTIGYGGPPLSLPTGKL